MKIELTEKERVELIEFLSRVDLKGFEVPAYVNIASKINHPMLEKIGYQLVPIIKDNIKK